MTMCAVELELEISGVELECEVHLWTTGDELELKKLSYFDEELNEHDISFMIPQLRSVILTKLDIEHD